MGYVSAERALQDYAWRFLREEVDDTLRRSAETRGRSERRDEESGSIHDADWIASVHACITGDAAD